MLSGWGGLVADTILVFMIDLLRGRRQLKETKRELLQHLKHFTCFVLKHRKLDENRERPNVSSKFEPICNSFEPSH